jgi:copper(I)-binding protein
MKKNILLGLLLNVMLNAHADVQVQKEEFAADVITVKTPEVVAVPNGSRATEAFMELNNKGKQLHQLVSVYSPSAKVTQIQHLVHAKDKSEMQQVNSISIAPNQAQNLQVDGFYLLDGG